MKFWELRRDISGKTRGFFFPHKIMGTLSERVCYLLYKLFLKLSSMLLLGCCTPYSSSPDNTSGKLWKNSPGGVKRKASMVALVLLLILP